PVDPPGVLIPHVPGGPAVHVADVLEQFAHAPARAGRDRGIEPGPLSGTGEQLALRPQAGDVVGDVTRTVLRCGHASQHGPARPPTGTTRGAAAARPGGPRLPGACQLCDHGTNREARRKVVPVTAQYPALSAAEIDLSDTEFWGWPLAERRAAFAVLRAAEHPPFFAEP